MDTCAGIGKIGIMQPFWNPNPPTHHSTIQTPFLRFMYIFVIILMIAKVKSPLFRFYCCCFSSDIAITTKV